MKRIGEYECREEVGVKANEERRSESEQREVGSDEERRGGESDDEW